MEYDGLFRQYCCLSMLLTSSAVTMLVLGIMAFLTDDTHATADKDGSNEA